MNSVDPKSTSVGVHSAWLLNHVGAGEQRPSRWHLEADRLGGKVRDSIVPGGVRVNHLSVNRSDSLVRVREDNVKRFPRDRRIRKHAFLELLVTGGAGGCSLSRSAVLLTFVGKLREGYLRSRVTQCLGGDSLTIASFGEQCIVLGDGISQSLSGRFDSSGH